MGTRVSFVHLDQTKYSITSTTACNTPSRRAFREFRKLFHVRSSRLPFLSAQPQPPAYVKL